MVALSMGTALALLDGGTEKIPGAGVHLASQGCWIVRTPSEAELRKTARPLHYLLALILGMKMDGALKVRLVALNIVRESGKTCFYRKFQL